MPGTEQIAREGQDCRRAGIAITAALLAAGRHDTAQPAAALAWQWGQPAHPWVRFSIVLVLGLFVTLIGYFPTPADEKGELVMSGLSGRFLTCRGMGCRPWYRPARTPADLAI